jgi:ribosomal-protein-alanine N-acetyltransferase
MPGEILETVSLYLRPLRAADADRLWNVWSEEPVRRFLITAPVVREDFDRVFQTMMDQSDEGRLWGIEEKATGSLLGRCGFYVWDQNPGAPEFAILLTEASWGRRLATEATEACLNFGFRRMGWTRVIAVARPENAPVRRLLKRAGFQEDREVEIRGAPALWLSAVRPLDRTQATTPAA